MSSDTSTRVEAVLSAFDRYLQEMLDERESRGEHERSYNTFECREALAEALADALSDRSTCTLAEETTMDLASVSTDDLTAELCRRLALGTVVPDYEFQDTRVGVLVPGELTTVPTARGICAQLLDAAKADGLSGCRLCCS